MVGMIVRVSSRDHGVKRPKGGAEDFGGATTTHTTSRHTAYYITPTILGHFHVFAWPSLGLSCRACLEIHESQGHLKTEPAEDIWVEGLDWKTCNWRNKIYS